MSNEEEVDFDTIREEDFDSLEITLKRKDKEDVVLSGDALVGVLLEEVDGGFEADTMVVGNHSVHGLIECRNSIVETVTMLLNQIANKEGEFMVKIGNVIELHKNMSEVMDKLKRQEFGEDGISEGMQQVMEDLVEEADDEDLDGLDKLALDKLQERMGNI